MFSYILCDYVIVHCDEYVMDLDFMLISTLTPALMCEFFVKPFNF